MLRCKDIENICGFWSIYPALWTELLISLANFMESNVIQLSWRRGDATKALNLAKLRERYLEKSNIFQVVSSNFAKIYNNIISVLLSTLHSNLLKKLCVNKQMLWHRFRQKPLYPCDTAPLTPPSTRAIAWMNVNMCQGNRGKLCQSSSWTIPNLV